MSHRWCRRICRCRERSSPIAASRLVSPDLCERMIGCFHARLAAHVGAARCYDGAFWLYRAGGHFRRELHAICDPVRQIQVSRPCLRPGRFQRTLRSALGRALSFEFQITWNRDLPLSGSKAVISSDAHAESSLALLASGFPLVDDATRRGVVAQFLADSLQGRRASMVCHARVRLKHDPGGETDLPQRGPSHCPKSRS